VAGGEADLESVLIRVSKPYTSMVDAIQTAGGTVTRQYRYFDGLAARIPRSALPALERLAGPGAITKDLKAPLPSPVNPSGIPGREPLPPRRLEMTFDSVEAIEPGDVAAFAAADPDAYWSTTRPPTSTSSTRLGMPGRGSWWRSSTPESVRATRISPWTAR